MRVEEGEGEGDSDRLTPPGDRLETRCSTVPSGVGGTRRNSVFPVQTLGGVWNGNKSPKCLSKVVIRQQINRQLLHGDKRRVI